MTCRLHPAEELAGDFCDIFTLGRNSLAVVIGDIANKGVAASLMTFSLLSMFRNIAKTHKSPCEIVKRINRSLISQIKEEGWFATAFYARLNTKTGVLTYSSAGHETPMWYHADTGLVEMLDASGYPLGLFSEFEYETREIQMQVGDRLILYTDGVSDAVNPSGQRLGHHALMDLTSQHKGLPCAEFTETILAKVHNFMGGQKQRDDMIVAVLELQDDPWIHKTVPFKESAALITEIMDALVPYNLDTATTYGVRLSVDEAVSNAWRHGLSGRDDVPFEVSYLISDDVFQLRVRDAGSGFDHESLPDPTVEENLFKSHGRGVFLIRQVMDEVEFNEAGNEITISKRFPPISGAEESMDEPGILDSVPALRQQQESLAKARKAGSPTPPIRSLPR
jgi:anti-sigma regulatory factor (Ser/Thr protein kinase)